MQTWEMIKKLSKNPKLKAKSDEWIVYIDKRGSFHMLDPNGDEEELNLTIFDEWEIIEEPVSWQEAIQAWLNGKDVYCVSDDVKINISGENNVLEDVNHLYLTKDDFKNGKWYINE